MNPSLQVETTLLTSLWHHEDYFSDSRKLLYEPQDIAQQFWEALWYFTVNWFSYGKSVKSCVKLCQYVMWLCTYLYVKEEILPLLSFSLWLIASEVICAAAFDIVSYEVSCFEVLKWYLSPQTASPLQLCMAAVHSLWIQPAFYQCIPDCANLMAGSWHGDTSLVDVSSVQLAEGSCGHYSTVHLSALFCSMGMVFGGLRLDCWHGPEKQRWHNTWSPEGIGWVALSSETTVPLGRGGHLFGSMGQSLTSGQPVYMQGWKCGNLGDTGKRSEWSGMGGGLREHSKEPLQITNQDEWRNGWIDGEMDRERQTY